MKIISQLSLIILAFLIVPHSYDFAEVRGNYMKLKPITARQGSVKLQLDLIWTTSPKNNSTGAGGEGQQGYRNSKANISPPKLKLSWYLAGADLCQRLHAQSLYRVLRQQRNPRDQVLTISRSQPTKRKNANMTSRKPHRKPKFEALQLVAARGKS